ARSIKEIRRVGPATRRRERYAEMQISGTGGEPPSRGALQESLLDQVRLYDVLERAALLAERRREALDADGAAVELLDDGEQESPIHRVETVRIDLEQIHRGLRDGLRDFAVGFDLRVVAHAPQQAVRDARRSARACRDLARAQVVYRQIENARGAPRDLSEIGSRIEFEMLRDAESIAQRRRQESRACRRADERERLQRQLDRARAGPFADHQVELKILERRVQHFLDDGAQAMALVDEQHVVR